VLKLFQLPLHGIKQAPQSCPVAFLNGFTLLLQYAGREQAKIPLQLVPERGKKAFPFQGKVLFRLDLVFQGRAMPDGSQVFMVQRVPFRAQAGTGSLKLAAGFCGLFVADGKTEKSPAQSSMEQKDDQKSGKKDHGRSRQAGGPVQAVDQGEQGIHGGSAHSVQAAQFVKLFKQFQDKRASGQVDPQVTLQADSGLDPLDFQAGKTPLARRVLVRTEHALVNHFKDEISRDPAHPAHFGQGAAGILVQYGSGQYGHVFGCHIFLIPGGHAD
jgi:hypothetical protein